MTETAFTHNHRVRLHEVDGAGLLFFGQLFTLAHNCYEELLLAAALPLQEIVEQGEFSIPLVHAEADYHHPIHQGELLRLTIHVSKIGEHSFTLKTLVESTDKHGGSILRGVVTTVHVTISSATGESIPLPDPLREILHRHG